MEASSWSSRYETGITKWDLGSSPEPLGTFLRTLENDQGILIPGCGRGYEIREFILAGHRVKAIDFAPGALASAREVIGAFAEGIICADFFNIPLEEESFDVCYERTFLCALPVELRHKYGARISSLIKPNGLLVGVFLYGSYVDQELPWPLNSNDRKTILEPFLS